MPADITSHAFIAAYIGGILGLGLGMFAILRPHGAARLVGITIDPALPHSISEVRATYGGVFAGGHALALATGHEMAFLALACGWAGAAVVRAASMVADQAVNGANLGGTAFEAVTAVLLAMPVLAAL